MPGGPAPAEAGTPTDRDYFELWNGCGAVRLLVESLNDKAAEIGLTEERIETTVRSRLRATGI